MNFFQRRALEKIWPTTHSPPVTARRKQPSLGTMVEPRECSVPPFIDLHEELNTQPTFLEELETVQSEGTLLANRTQIMVRVNAIAKDLQFKFSHTNKPPVVLVVMRGAMFFASELLLSLDTSTPVELDYVDISRYANNKDTGQVVWKKCPSVALTNRAVVIVDDILDSGTTLDAIIAAVKNQNPTSITTIVMVNKMKRSDLDVLSGFETPKQKDAFFFGYGMDYKEHLRGLLNIQYLTPTALNGLQRTTR